MERDAQIPPNSRDLRVHFPKPAKPRESPLAQRVGLAADVVTIAAGSQELIKLLVEVWHSIPFGPGPRMPNDYHYLAGKVGAFFPSSPNKMMVFTAGASSIDWHTARYIFDVATELLDDNREAYSSDESLRIARATELSLQIGRLLDTMQKPVLEMLCEKIGEEFERPIDWSNCKFVEQEPGESDVLVVKGTQIRPEFLLQFRSQGIDWLADNYHIPQDTIWAVFAYFDQQQIR